ncbi:amidase [Shimia ponticola]|uniref:amidase n=1 Tax=Shimia ponticola TaxID=2582893 RepID=UPI0011BD4603|nr:amidase family protein [Shimia ponticola]
MKDWLTKSAAEQGRAIGKRDLDPVALAEAYLDAIEAHEFGPRIYARTTRERALSEAAAAHDRAKSGMRVGPLDGVPISWKDLFDTAGVATEAGSALLEGRVPDRDARVLRAATRAGTVCLGKTHMSELAFSGLGLNPITASSPCVNDHEAISGGSSSGAAASVAFGLAAAAVGSDTGGSVRIPAAWNDLVGLKTTSGRLSLEGVVPLCKRFDTVGPLTRTVEDAALMLAALEGGSAPDLSGASLSGMRFLVIETIALDAVEPVPGQAFDDSVARFEAAGAVIDRRTMPMLNDVFALMPALFPAEAYGQWKDVIEANPEKMFHEILARFRGGANVSGPDFVAAWNTLEACRATFWEEVAGYDAVLIPSSPILPPNIEKLMRGDSYYVSANLLALRNTRLGNLMGAASLTVPTGVPSCGAMFVTAPGCEERLLRIGAAAEMALQ